MKKNNKNYIVLITFLFFTANVFFSCSILGDDIQTLANNSAPAIARTNLPNSLWVNGNITSSSGVDWYSFPVSNGTTYRVWWNDRIQGNGTKTGFIAVGARYSGSSSWLFGGTSSSVSYGWSSAQSFTANRTGTVEIRVIPNNQISSNTGTYGIVFSNSFTRPSVILTNLTINQWTNGTITSSSGEDWYSFPVSNGTTYRVWWNDSNQGNGTKTGFIAVGARYSGSSSWLFGGTNSSVSYGWSSAQSFTANQTGTVEIRVIPYNRSSSYTGTYGIAYGTSNTRPEVNFQNLNINQWTSGNITTAGGEQWFSFTATANPQYIHVIFGSLSDLYIDVYDNSFNQVGSIANLYSSTRSTVRYVTTGQVYHIKVYPYSNSSSGTYQIVFNASSTAPAQ